MARDDPPAHAPGFELVNRRRIASLQIDYQAYVHVATGVRHFHFACDDSNNVFSIAFPTFPEDSTGIAHILEHTALCGSRRFPVRDPFFMMLRRSLNTFMNAFTGADATAYPFATRNRKDFDNLLQVYLDAVFFPLLAAEDFAQEGHRLEFERDASGELRLVLKGVVYNEMKGAMSSPLTQLWHHLQQNLFPTTTYHHNSGGDPSHIPDLTHAALRQFHATHYHPSNAIIMTYGCFPVAEHQARLEELVLAHFVRQAPVAPSGYEHRYTAPREISTTYPVAMDDGAQAHLIWGWLLGKSVAVDDYLDAHLLGDVLLRNGASPLRHLLETTPLATAPSELCGVEDSANELVFCCGVEGSEPQHAAALERDITALLADVAAQGIDADVITATIDAMELAQRDISGDGYPYGLRLMSRTLAPVVHGADPVAFLDLDPALAALRERAGDRSFVPRLIQRELLGNPHRVRVVMAPDVAAAQREAEAEQLRLRTRQQSLTEAQVALIDAQAEVLRARQGAAEQEALLPKVTLADVPREVETVQGSDGMIGCLPRRRYSRGTNGIVYHHLVVPIPGLALADVPWLPYFSAYLTEVGYGDHDYLNAERVRAGIGVFQASLSVRADRDDPNRLCGYLALAGKSLARKQEALAATLAAIHRRVRFDEPERLRDLVAQARAEAESSITERGHVMAMYAASAAFSPHGWLDEQWDGLSSVRALKRIDDAMRHQDDAALLAGPLAGLTERLQHVVPRLLVVGEAAECDAADLILTHLWREHTGTVESAAAALPTGARAPCRNTAWTASTRVNFCARAYAAVPEAHPDAPALMVLGRYLHNGYLHQAIRERGGAYGSGASYASDSAVFRFYSYRDPRLLETLQDFDESLAWFRAHSDGRRLEEAILGVIGQLDQPESPAGAALRAYYDELHGRDPGFRQSFRNRVLAVQYDDLARVCDAYLEPERAVTAVVTSADRAAQLDRSGFSVESL